jgi:hypothetical protein
MTCDPAVPTDAVQPDSAASIERGDGGFSPSTTPSPGLSAVPIAEAAGVLIVAMLRVLADLATPARAVVSAVNALLALERQRLGGGVGLAGLLADEVRLAITTALTRLLSDEAAPARTTIAAANSLLALERNRLRAERRERANAERELDSAGGGLPPPLARPSTSLGQGPVPPAGAEGEVARQSGPPAQGSGVPRSSNSARADAAPDPLPSSEGHPGSSSGPQERPRTGIGPEGNPRISGGFGGGIRR